MRGEFKRPPSCPTSDPINRALKRFQANKVNLKTAFTGKIHEKESDDKS